MDIDDKLAAYRSRKKKEQQIEKTKKALYDLATLQFMSKDKTNLSADSTPQMAERINLNGDISEPETLEAAYPENLKSKKIFSHLIRVNYFLYFLLWVSLYVIAVEFEFGIVYFMFSLLFFIWFNTRTGPKKTGEVSAYSVFNPNCEAIDGTLNAEQFESELRYGAISIH